MATQDISKQDRWLQEIRDSQGDYEQEVMSGHEADLYKHFNSCTKNPGHVQFIDVNTFRSEHLPGRYRSSQKLIDLVRAQADVTCLITVSYVSPDRPQTFPFYNYRGRRGFSRSGTGWVCRVTVYTEEDRRNNRQYTPCQCQTCQRSGEPRSDWAKVWICTASHVVFDKSEAEASKCYFFYDNSQQQLSDCPVISGHVYKVCSDRSGDVSEICYYIHDLELARRLQDMFGRYESLCVDLRNRFVAIRHDVPDRVVKENDDEKNKVQLPSDKSKGNSPTGHGMQDHLSHGEDYRQENNNDEENEDNVNERDDDWLYKSEHDLMFITSHPHGCSKMVTVGQVTHRSQVSVGLIRYEYSTATCPGSSGAPVFLLGRFDPVYHVHSRHVRGQGPEQINRSGA